MRNFFAYLRLPASSDAQTLQSSLTDVPDDEHDVHYVLSDETALTHYRRVHQQCQAMAVLLSTTTDDDGMLNKSQWQKRLSEFGVDDDQID
jgi:hypothetical protein